MKTSKEYYQKGVECYHQNNINEAIENFTSCIEIEPENIFGLCNRGLSYYKNYEYKKAIIDFTKTIELDSHSWIAYLNRSLSYKESGYYDLSLKDLKTIQKQCNEKHILIEVEKEIQSVINCIDYKEIPSSVFKQMINIQKTEEDYLKEGRSLEDKNNHKTAIESYSKAINLNPKFKDAYYSRARCYYTIGDFEKAITDYKNIEDEEIYGEDIKINIGNAYSELNEFELSLEYFNKAEKINSKNSENYFFRAETKEKMGNNEGAFMDFTKALELSSNPIEPIYRRGIVRMRISDFSGAIQDFEKMEKLNNNDARPYFHKGIAYFQLNEKSKSLEQLNIASKMGFKKADEIIEKISG